MEMFKNVHDKIFIITPLSSFKYQTLYLIKNAPKFIVSHATARLKFSVIPLKNVRPFLNTIWMTNL